MLRTLSVIKVQSVSREFLQVNQVKIRFNEKTFLLVGLIRDN